MGFKAATVFGLAVICLASPLLGNAGNDPAVPAKEGQEKKITVVTGPEPTPEEAAALAAAEAAAEADVKAEKKTLKRALEEAEAEASPAKKAKGPSEEEIIKLQEELEIVTKPIDPTKDVEAQTEEKVTLSADIENKSVTLLENILINGQPEQKIALAKLLLTERAALIKTFEEIERSTGMTINQLISMYYSMIRSGRVGTKEDFIKEGATIKQAELVVDSQSHMLTILSYLAENGITEEQLIDVVDRVRKGDKVL